MTNAKNVNMSRYIFIFLAAYVVSTIIFGVVGYITGSSSLGAIKLIFPMLCANFVNDSFLKRERRLYTPMEKKNLIWKGLFGVLLIELFLSAVIIFSGSLSDMNFANQTLVLITFGTLVFMLALNYGLLLWVYGTGAEKRLERIEKNMAVLQTHLIKYDHSSCS